MAQIYLDAMRNNILHTSGHLLIEGGPGCGKTTIALLKAKKNVERLEQEQRILFLSFSRAAVRQVTERMSGILTSADRKAIEVRTFHAFFLEVIRSHGCLLTGAPARFITPEREAQRRADYDGDWALEKMRLAREESVFVFDTLAPLAADLMERSADVRHLYSDRYPLIIIDEFQDTNRDQWRVIKALAEDSTTVCLADPDQRIFDHLDGIDEYRLEELRKTLLPTSFDLSEDNHRSPSGGILDYANAVLLNQSVEMPKNVVDKRYRYRPTEIFTHELVVATREVLTDYLGSKPSIAILTRTNALAARISEALTNERSTDKGDTVPAIDHVLAWEPELVAASALVIASILEWPLKQQKDAVVDTLIQIADYYRIKLGNGTMGARSRINTLTKSIAAIEAYRKPAAKTAQVLLERFKTLSEFTGQPVSDWQTARAKLTDSAELDEIFRHARFLRLLKATDALAWALLDAWNGTSGYISAADVVRLALADQAVNVAQKDTPKVSVMTMHKSKGKEFDGVIIVEDRYQGELLSQGSLPRATDRRLLRVAITRARHVVVFVRPHDARPLTPP